MCLDPLEVYETGWGVMGKRHGSFSTRQSALVYIIFLYGGDISETGILLWLYLHLASVENRVTTVQHGGLLGLRIMINRTRLFVF